MVLSPFYRGGDCDFKGKDEVTQPLLHLYPFLHAKVFIEDLLCSVRCCQGFGYIWWPKGEFLPCRAYILVEGDWRDAVDIYEYAVY